MKKFDYSKKDIVNALIEIGICSGDNLFLHSNIGFFGRLKDVEGNQQYYYAFKEALFEVIGPDGTFVTPTFSYSFCHGKIYDKAQTLSTCGFLTEMVRNDPQSFRSDDANFSIAALGKNAKYFTEDAPEYSFGENSFWEKFISIDGKICNLNFDAGSTFFHYIERKIGVSYRFDKKFTGFSLINGTLCEKTFYHFCRNLNRPDLYPDNTKFHLAAKKIGYAKIANLGRGQIVSISAKNTFDLIQQELLNDPYFLVKGLHNVGECKNANTNQI